jgi:hypothetical protein
VKLLILILLSLSFSSLASETKYLKEISCLDYLVKTKCDSINAFKTELENENDIGPLEKNHFYNQSKKLSYYLHIGKEDKAKRQLERIEEFLYEDTSNDIFILYKVNKDYLWELLKAYSEGEEYKLPRRYRKR